MITLILPFPPSINHYYGRKGFKTFLLSRGLEYRNHIAIAVRRNKLQRLKGKISLHVEVIPKDNRKHDIDNILKCLFDSLEHSGLIANDNDIHRLVIDKLEPRKPGMLKCTISEITK